MNRSLRVFVAGIPRPQGSKRAFVRPGALHATMVESSKHVKDWRADVRAAAWDAWQEQPHAGPVAVDVRFWFARPKSHYRTGKNAQTLREAASADWCMTNKPDVDKLTRAVCDALSGVVFVDDSVIVSIAACKGWRCRFQGGGPGADIIVRCLDDDRS